MRHAMAKVDWEGLDEGSRSVCGNQQDGEYKWKVHKDREPCALPIQMRLPIPASV